MNWHHQRMQVHMRMPRLCVHLVRGLEDFCRCHLTPIIPSVSAVKSVYGCRAVPTGHVFGNGWAINIHKITNLHVLQLSSWSGFRGIWLCGVRSSAEAWIMACTSYGSESGGMFPLLIIFCSPSHRALVEYGRTRPRKESILRTAATHSWKTQLH